MLMLTDTSILQIPPATDEDLVRWLATNVPIPVLKKALYQAKLADPGYLGGIDRSTIEGMNTYVPGDNG